MLGLRDPRPGTGRSGRRRRRPHGDARPRAGPGRSASAATAIAAARPSTSSTAVPMHVKTDRLWSAFGVHVEHAGVRGQCTPDRVERRSVAALREIGNRLEEAAHSGAQYPPRETPSLGMFFGFYAFFDPSQHWIDNRIFDLMVQRTYGAMTNDVLISIPLFVLMGYVMERGALVDKMFYIDPARVPWSAGVARRGGADRVHVLGHRQRPGGRGRGADGRYRVQPDAQGGIRREARRQA